MSTPSQRVAFNLKYSLVVHILIIIYILIQNGGFKMATQLQIYQRMKYVGLRTNMQDA